MGKSQERVSEMLARNSQATQEQCGFDLTDDHDNRCSRESVISYKFDSFDEEFMECGKLEFDELDCEHTDIITVETRSPKAKRPTMNRLDSGERITLGAVIMTCPEEDEEKNS